MFTFKISSYHKNFLEIRDIFNLDIPIGLSRVSEKQFSSLSLAACRMCNRNNFLFSVFMKLNDF